MGLDMYLEREWFVGAVYDRGVTGKIEITIAGEPLDIDFNKVVTINERAAYWRKANAIHKWFVDNVQDGEDDCGRYNVSWEQLITLKELCEKVLQNKEKAEELLPTQSGFFFGGTDYDEYYFQDCEITIKQITEALAKEGGYFYYESSW